MFIDSYNHISFDLWLTLIKSNPEFKKSVNEFFYNEFNSAKLDFTEVVTIVKSVDVEMNSLSENTGIHVDSKFIIYNILKRLNSSTKNIIDIDKRIQHLFLKNLPSLYDENTLYVLNKLYEIGKSMNILSNTGFIHGQTIEVALDRLKILKYFKFRVYSDETKISKPNPDMFRKVSFFADKPKKLHVGDNPYADGACTRVVNHSFAFFQVNSNSNTIIDLLK